MFSQQLLRRGLSTVTSSFPEEWSVLRKASHETCLSFSGGRRWGGGVLERYHLRNGRTNVFEVAEDRVTKSYTQNGFSLYHPYHTIAVGAGVVGASLYQGNIGSAAAG